MQINEFPPGPVRADAFGRDSLSLRGLIDALTDIAAANPAMLDAPVWVDGQTIFKPARNVIVNAQRRAVIEVHHV